MGGKRPLNDSSRFVAAAAAAASLQSSPTLCDPIDGSPPGSPVPGIFQARTLAWVAISVSNAGKWKVKVKSLSRAQLLATPWTAAYQAPPLGLYKYLSFKEANPHVHQMQDLRYSCGILVCKQFWKHPPGGIINFLAFRCGPKIIWSCDYIAGSWDCRTD